jgi:hypothetical protein
MIRATTQHRMYATLLAQPLSWARFTPARCAPNPPNLHAYQQRRVMPTLGRVLPEYCIYWY